MSRLHLLFCLLALTSCTREVPRGHALFFSGDEGIYEVRLPAGRVVRVAKRGLTERAWPVSRVSQDLLAVTMCARGVPCSVGILRPSSRQVRLLRPGAAAVGIGGGRVLFRETAQGGAGDWVLWDPGSSEIVSRYAWRALSVESSGPDWSREALPVAADSAEFIYLSTDSVIWRVHAATGQMRSTGVRGVIPKLWLAASEGVVGVRLSDREVVECYDVAGRTLEWAIRLSAVGFAAEPGDTSFLVCAWRKGGMDDLDIHRVSVKDGSVVVLRRNLLMRYGVAF